MKTVRHVAVPIAVLLFICSCAGLSPSTQSTSANPSTITDPFDVKAVEIYNSFYPVLNTSFAIYNSINDLAESSHKAGLLTDDQMRKIGPVLSATYTAITTAAETGTKYLKSIKSGDTSQAGQFTSEFILAQDTFNGLLKIAKELGVIQ